MAKLLKVSIGAVWTVGLVICPLPEASTLGYSTVLSNLFEQITLKNSALVGADFSHRVEVPDNLSSTQFFSASNQHRDAQARSLPPTVQKSLKQGLLSAGSDAPPDHDGDRFRTIMQDAIARSLHDRPMGEVMQAIAHQLLGSRYQSNLLDKSSQETLVTSLTQFDCVLFVETVLALARGIAIQDYSYQTFTENLQDQRYRNGTLGGYCSRLHYFSEWLTDNQRRGNVFQVATDLRDVSSGKLLDFMSTHRNSYPRLVNNPPAYQCVRQMEANLTPFAVSYVPHDRIRQLFPRLKPGDIVAIATNIPGLDVTHTGLVYRNPDGSIGLIHATPGSGVKITPNLQRYIDRVEDGVGVMVARPVDPRGVVSRRTGAKSG